MSSRWNTDTLIGERLGSCVLERPLGVGGMGAVYLARQERPRRQVAVKVLVPQQATDDEMWPVMLARFQREADATAALDHANIVPIYEFGDQGGIFYLVMPYLTDGSLAGLLARAGRLPLDHAVVYLAQAGSALDYAHGHGIIHRDVKPSNLLLHPDGRLLLADFGIARPLNRAELVLPPDVLERQREEFPDDVTLTVAGSVVGTPQYMAPELVRGEQGSPATDLYALAVVAYSMLVGELPFDGATTNEILARQLTEKPPSLRAKRQGIPRQVDEVMLWALSKRPQDRPETAGVFVESLREASKGKALGSLWGVPQTGRRRTTYAGVGAEGVALAGAPREKYEHDAPTLFASGTPAGRGGTSFGGPPVWPGVPQDDEDSREPRPRASWLIAFAAGAAVLLVLMLGVGAMASGMVGLVLPSGDATQPVVNAKPTATPTVVASPTAVVNWLTASPTSIALGCKANNKSARITLQNLGPEDTWWYATPLIIPGISVSPVTEKAPAGGSITVTITNTSLYSSHDGTITFNPTASDAGDAPTVSYTASACR